MTNSTYRKLNPTETILNSLPAIIEAFVTFYGESERERITNKLTNMLVIGYASPDNMSTTIRNSNTEQSNILINRFLEQVTDKEEMDKLRKLYFDNNELKFSILHPINKYINYVDGNNTSDYNKKDVVEFLKQINPETTVDNLDELINQGKFKNVDKLVPLYKEALEKYKKYSTEMEPYTNYVNKCNELKSNLEKKYTKKLIEKLKDLFNEEEYQQIQAKFNDKYFVLIRDINGKTKNYLSYSLEGSPLIESFSNQNDEILINGQTWRKDSVKRDRIQYFKNLGLDLGDNYELYETNPKAKALTPSKETVDRVINETKNMYTKMMNEFYTSLPEYQKNRSRIEEQNLLDKEDGYDANAYERNSTAITTNLKLIDGNYVEYPILFLYIGLMEEYYDKDLIHELNHVCELHLQNIKDNYYQMTCGWDIVDGQINNQRPEEVQLEENHEKRNYELFNEIINEIIAQEISEILSQSGIYIFNTKENKKIKGGTSYERTMFLVKKFYETYKKEIIESRKNGDVSILFDTIGQENFEDLNQLFHEYLDNFNEFEIYTVYQDLKNGKETEKTRKLKEITLKRDTILSKMEEQNHKRKVSI